MIADLKRAVRPDAIRVYENLAMVAVVGRGMISAPGVAAKVFSALAKEKINIRMIDQGSSELNIIVGIAAKDYIPALKAIYKEFEPTL